jgi:cysteine desulfurase/selenocysteine lyase
MSTAWDEVRSEFPAVGRHVWLNAASCGLAPRVVRAAVDRFHRELEEDGDLCWEAWIVRRDQARASLARLIGAEASEIAFVSNTSAGMNVVAELLAEDGAVLTDELEFPAVTLPWIHRGATVHFQPVVEGVVRQETFVAPYAPRAATIALSHVQFSNGCRQDLDAFGALKAGRRLVVSGSQSVGALRVDVKASGVDALACAGHKWLGAGYGAGFVYLSADLLARRPKTVGWMSVERPFAFDNRSTALLPTAARHELGCPAFAAAFAAGAAADFVTSIGVEAIEERVLHLNGVLTDGLERAGFQVLSPGGAYRSGQTLVAVPDPRSAASFLREHNVMVTRKPDGLRISTHYYNNEADIEAAIRGLVEYVRVHRAE